MPSQINKGDLFKALFIALHPEVPPQKSDIETINTALDAIRLLKPVWLAAATTSALAHHVHIAVASIKHEPYCKVWNNSTPFECLDALEAILTKFVSAQERKTPQNDFEVHAACALCQAFFVEFRNKENEKQRRRKVR